MVIVVSQLMKITPALLICEPLCHDPAAVGTHTIKQGSSRQFLLMRSYKKIASSCGLMAFTAAGDHLCFDFIIL